MNLSLPQYIQSWNRNRSSSLGTMVLLLALAGGASLWSDPAPASSPPPDPAPTPTEATASTAAPAPGANGAQPEKRYNVKAYKIIGGKHLLTRDEFEDAVYPYMGNYVTAHDIDQARRALEKAFVEKGYQTCSVEIPTQKIQDGVVVFKVVAGEVERLRVTNSRYFLPSDIRTQTPSLAEGTVPNFNDVTHDVLALNVDPDRQVIPVIRAGQAPGSIDVDLNVKDKYPLHGSVEVDNRYSLNTTPLRTSANISYDNLWQLGHSLNLTFQVAPENPNDALAYTGSYLARIPEVPWLSFMVYGLASNSDVATLGGSDVVGKGHVIGFRTILTLPSNDKGFFHNLSLGFDYKDFDELDPGSSSPLGPDTPIKYVPFVASYNATWQAEKSLTQLDLTLTTDFRGLGSSTAQFDAKRFDATGSFAYLRGDFSRQQTLPEDFQIWGKMQGQVADQPLVNSEEFAAGGLDTVRGYLESEVLTDDGVIGSFEMRSPSLGRWLGSEVNEWRFYGFGDAARMVLLDPLPEQQQGFSLASAGIGTRFQIADHINGSLDFALPLIAGPETPLYHSRLTFKLSAYF